MSRAATALPALTVLLVAVMVPLSAGQEEVFDTVLYATLALTLTTVGALVVRRGRANRIGWLFLALGLWTALAELGEGYGYLAADRGLPGGAVGEWVITWSWMGDAAAWTLLVLLFPDGRLPSPRWRPVVYAIGLAFVLCFVGQGLSPDTGELFTSGENPVAVDGAAIGIAFAVGIVLLTAGLAAAVASSVRRFRRARGDERQQLKWFAFAGLIMAVLTPLAVALWSTGPLIHLVMAVALNAMPAAVGIAILRHGLYDIDLLIRRTLVYGALTATLAGAYLVAVLLLQVLLPARSGLAVAGSTLAVAALFRPALRTIQAEVDRRFYRRRYDAARTLEGFGARLRDEVALESLSAELRSVVDETMQPAHVSLWLREMRR